MPLWLLRGKICGWILWIWNSGERFGLRCIFGIHYYRDGNWSCKNEKDHPLKVCRARRGCGLELNLENLLHLKTRTVQMSRDTQIPTPSLGPFHCDSVFFHLLGKFWTRKGFINILDPVRDFSTPMKKLHPGRTDIFLNGMGEHTLQVRM